MFGLFGLHYGSVQCLACPQLSFHGIYFALCIFLSSYFVSIASCMYTCHIIKMNVKCIHETVKKADKG